jgi:2',3'-cyclic-nucleotide 2'-phosphodiesterase (5'-nucleotidase family)
MRKIFSLALVALAMTITVSAWGADNSLGTWKANVAKCKYTPAPWPVKSLTVTREAAPGGLKVTNTGMRTDGSAINASYTAKYGGSSSEVTGEGSPYDSISVKQGDANTFTYEAKNSKNKYRASGRIVISGDGKTMTATASGVDADGKPMTLKIVYDKQ